MIEFGFFSEFSDSVTKGSPVMMAVAKMVELGPFCCSFYQSMGKLPRPLTQKEFEVYSRSKTARGGAIAASWTKTATSALAVPADLLKGLTVGHVLRFGNDGEAVIISEIDRAANTISVYSRGAGSTSASTHASGDAFRVIGYAGNDDDIEKVEGFNETTSKYQNYVQTVYEAVTSKLHGELARKGLENTNETVLNLLEAQQRLAELLGRMAILGIKQKPEDDSDRYMSAGLISQLSDNNGGKRAPNIASAFGLISEKSIHDAVMAVFNRGGNLDTLWVHPTVKGYIDNLPFSDSILTRDANAQSHTHGMGYISHIEVDGRLLAVRQDSDIPEDTIAGVMQSDCKKGWLEGDGLRLTDEPVPSTRKKRKVMQGSVGFLVENVGFNHLLISGITGGPTEKVHKVQVQGMPAATVAGSVATTREIVVNADADVPTASDANFGYRVKIGTAWTEGTKIVTAVKDEVYASNGSAWVKQ